MAEVYKGCLQDGQLITVKILTKGTTDEKTAGFLRELGVIAHVDHPNTAKPPLPIIFSTCKRNNNENLPSQTYRI